VPLILQQELWSEDTGRSVFRKQERELQFFDPHASDFATVLEMTDVQRILQQLAFF
jgi:hypothetical protein